MKSSSQKKSSLTEVLLGDVILFQRGFDITKNQQASGNIPIVSSSGITSYHNKWKTTGPGVVIGRKGTLGKVHYLQKNFWPHDTTLWVKDFKGNDPRFCYYFMQTLHLENFDTGSSNPTLNRNHIHKIKILFPNLKIQKKIAAILSAYDDLIENNKRRIALLEKMAEEIYREWFVRFRFPGHEKVKFVKGVPEGWEIKKVGDIVDRKKFGRIYREAELLKEGDVIVIDQSRKKCLGFHNEKAEHEASIEDPLILFGDHSCKMQLMIEPFSLAENVIPFSGTMDMPIFFLFHLINSLIETTEYKRHWTVLINKKVLLPSHDLQQKYDDQVRDFIVMKRKLISANENLNKTRDLLLPRLISGKLSVENLDIQFPPNMQTEEET